MARAFLITVLAAVFATSGMVGAVCAHDFSGHGVVELYVNDGPYTAHSSFKKRARHKKGSAVSSGTRTLYSAEVMPGEEYTVGLVFRPVYKKVRVTLYDRWPYLQKARAIELPVGPRVATNRKRTELRWQTGISLRSTSTLLYIVVEMEPSVEASAGEHSVFIITPPAKASSTVGRGITFLQGPSDMVLAGDGEDVSYVVEKPEAKASPSAFLVRNIPGDIVRNGWFRDGLNHWQPHREYSQAGDEGFFSLDEEGLKLSSAGGGGRTGLLQHIDADVTDAASLVLRADVRVNRQTQGGTGPDGRDAPVAIAVCYTDKEGVEHCGGKALWMGFYSLPPEGAKEALNGWKVPEGRWYRFITDLMELKPAPKTIRYISIEGSGWPEREGRVRGVHLIKRRINQ